MRTSFPAALSSVAIVGAAALACNGTTGDALVTFQAYAAGAEHAGDPFTVQVPNGSAATAYTVQIKSATMHIGALYLNQNLPSLTCISEGLYSDQVPGAIDVDLLSTKAQAFSLPGNGTADSNQALSLWLIDGDKTLPTSIDQKTDPIDGPNYDPSVVLQAVATNQATGVAVPFVAILSVNQANRGSTPADPAYPGENPLCSKRIVSVPLTPSVTVKQGDSLLLTIDPRKWFGSTIDFSALAAFTPPLVTSPCFDDTTIEAPPDLPDVGVTPTACIPNSNDTSFTNGFPLGQNFLTSVTAGSAAYSLSILKSD